MYSLVLLIPFFLSWGSFLSLVAHRLIRGKEIFWSRSSCPYCHRAISWYDLIPIFSWLWLKGLCRHCQHAISWLYPFIELLTALLLSLLFLKTSSFYFFGYFIFFSALIITIRSDIETMLISRFVTLFLVPVGFLFSYFGLLPITLMESFFGAFIGYGFLYFISKCFFWFTGKQGMGQGDLELMAFIGSFIGVTGSWTTLFLGSFIGSIAGSFYLLMSKQKKSLKIPFGPFLSLAAISYVLFQEQLTHFITGFIYLQIP